MKNFFKNKNTIVVIVSLSILLIIIILSVFIKARPLSNAVKDFIVYPVVESVNKLANEISEKIDYSLYSKDELIKEVENLNAMSVQFYENSAKIQSLEEENSMLKDYFSIKDELKLNLFPASVSFREYQDFYYGLVINKGQSSGVKAGQAVIYDKMLIGYIDEVFYNYATVKTVLYQDSNISSILGQSKIIGITKGNVGLADNNELLFMALSGFYNQDENEEKDDANKIDVNSIEIGEYVYTSGASQFYPENLILGRVKEAYISNEDGAVYAVVEPLVDIKSIKSVAVII